MKVKTLNWLFVITLLTWLIPWHGKRTLPSLFDSSLIQWGSAIVTAVLLSIGLFASINALFSNHEDRRKIAGACFGFIFLFSIIIFFYGVATPLMMRVRDSVTTMSADNSLPRFMRNVYSPDFAGKRENMAKWIYAYHGICVPYQLKDGSYVMFQPAQEDKDAWVKSKETEEKISQARTLLDWQLKQLPYISSIYIISFFLTFSIGTVWVCRKKTVMERAEMKKDSIES